MDVIRKQRSFTATNLVIFALLLIILGFGLNILLASSSFLARQEYGDPYFYLKKQLLFALFGLVCVFIFSQLDYRVWLKVAWPFYFFTLLLLLLVFLPGIGKKAGGASRWLNMGLFSIQPSDLARFATIMVLARIYSNAREIEGNTVLITLLIILVPSALISIEPDFSTALHLLIAAGAFLFFTGFPLRVHGVLMLALMPVVYYYVIKVPFRLERIKAFLDPWRYRYEGAYQLVASFKSFLAGDIWGKGLGEGLRRHNLQARHTDFILAIVAEDTGFAGILFCLALYFGITIYGLYLVMKTRDSFGRLLGSGIFMIFITQVTMNAAVAMGLIPTTGINMPLLSYGGTSLITYMIMFGIVLNILRTEYSRYA